MSSFCLCSDMITAEYLYSYAALSLCTIIVRNRESCKITVRFTMHRILADCTNSRGMSQVFCDLRSPKTPRGILPVNSNVKFICYSSVFFSFKHICFLSQRYLKKSLISTKLTFQQQSAAVLLLILMTAFHGIPHTRMQ